MPCASAECRAIEPEGTTQWVHLLPAAGDVLGRDGRAWRLADPHRVVRASMSIGRDLSVDYEHQSEKANKNGQPAPAAGWIKELDVREDGIWARIEWTPRAARMIADRECRFISPTFMYNRRTENIGRITGAGLTNHPNLHLKALARQEDTMELPQSITEALGLAEDADEETALNAIQSLKDAGADPERYVPVSAVKKMLVGAADEKEAMNAEKAEATVNGAMRDGKLPPALRDWGIALCRQNPHAFDEFLDRTPAAYADLGRQIVPAGSPPRDPSGSEEERALCASLGISLEDLRANMAETR